MSDWSTVRLNLRYHWKAALLWGIGIVGALIFAVWTMTDRAEAWVQGYQRAGIGQSLYRMRRGPGMRLDRTSLFLKERQEQMMIHVAPRMGMST